MPEVGRVGGWLLRASSVYLVNEEQRHVELILLSEVWSEWSGYIVSTTSRSLFWIETAFKKFGWGVGGSIKKKLCVCWCLSEPCVWAMVWVRVRKCPLYDWCLCFRHSGNTHGGNESVNTHSAHINANREIHSNLNIMYLSFTYRIPTKQWSLHKNYSA